MDADMIFFVTFGQKHIASHPDGFETHPDGYWTVTADSFGEALKLTRDTFGRFGFTNVLNDKQFVETSYSRGQLGTLPRLEPKTNGLVNAHVNSLNGQSKPYANGQENGHLNSGHTKVLDLSLLDKIDFTEEDTILSEAIPATEEKDGAALNADYKDRELIIRLDLSRIDEI